MDEKQGYFQIYGLKLRTKLLENIKLAVSILIFLLLFFSIDNVYGRQLLIYFLVSAGLYFSSKLPLASVLTNTIALLLLFLTITGKGNWPLYAGISAVMIVTMVIPLYYNRLGRLESDIFQKLQSPLDQRMKILEIKSDKIEADRNDLEKEIEKINQLYLLGRELVEHLDLNEVVDHLQRALLKRPGVRSVAIFQWEKGVWHPLFFSQPDTKDRWPEFVKRQEALFKEKNFKVLMSPAWLAEQTVVYWPVRLDKTLLAGIFLVTEPNMGDSYLDEGRIFIPQIALGLRRTNLFAEVQDRSREDGLTGLYLRRYFIERLMAEIQRAKRYSTGFSLLMMDIDDFKKINDSYGHLTGDSVLGDLARIFIQSTRPGDLVCRYGGEEFAIILPLASREETLQISERIRNSIAEKRFQSYNEDKTVFHVSISIGISYFPTNETALIPAADRALYWVKANGKNGIKEYAEIKK